MSEKGKKNKKKTGLGIAIWILTFLIILIVFLVKQEEIKENFDKSGASALIEKKIGKDIFEDKKDAPKTEETGETIIDLTKNLRKTEPVAKEEPKKEEAQKKTEQKTEEKSSKKKSEAEKTVQLQKTDEKKPEVTLKTAEKPETKTKTAEEKQPVQTKPKTETVAKSEPKQTQNTVQPKAEQKPAQTETKPAPAPEPVVSTIKAKICFVAIDSEGPVVRKIVSRSVHKDSPMGDALNQLIAGPSAAESNTGCRTLIPAGTRLLSASIKNGVATLNFSEEFQFNQFGAEGSLAQLMQVVYTATEFSTVKSVQILIEGQKKDYLTEGVWIGSPLNRSSF